MKEYSVVERDVNGKETTDVFTCQLPAGSTVQDLKRVYVEKDGIYEPEELKFCYKQESGNLRKNAMVESISMTHIWDTITHSIFFAAVEDDDSLVDVTAEDGVFLVQHPDLSFVDGTVYVYKEVPESVSVLLGSTKDFQHYIIKQGRGNNLKMPLGMFMMVFLE